MEQQTAGIAKTVGIGNTWVQMVSQQEEDKAKMYKEKQRVRRKGCVQFMDTQIRKLISEILRVGTKTDEEGKGIVRVTYGTLFHETLNKMPALSATLACAQKRGVLEFEGTLLMQGAHDDTIITLLKDEIEDSDFSSPIQHDDSDEGEVHSDDNDNDNEEYIQQSQFSSLDDKQLAPPEPTFMSSICPVCNKKVYPMDRISANEIVMHKSCFRCCVCQCVLTLSSFAHLDGRFFCEIHFKQNVKKGSNYNF